MKVCFDVIGQSQKSIFIIEDKLLNTKIDVILLDDYFGIQVGQRNSFHSWKNIIVSSLNKHSITFTIRINKEQNVLINVVRSKRSFGIEHLDTGFDSLEGETEMDMEL